jgi:hypothetical protein
MINECFYQFHAAFFTHRAEGDVFAAMLPAYVLFAWAPVILIGCMLLLCVASYFWNAVSGMSYFHKSLGKDVLFKPAQKFNMLHCHYFLLVAIIVIFVFKTNMAVIYVQNSVGSDGYFMCVAAEVFYDLCRATKRLKKY